MPNIQEQPDWEALQRKAIDRMAQVDAQEPEIRALIHRYNTNAVVAAYRAGCNTVAEIERWIRVHLISERQRVE